MRWGNIKQFLTRWAEVTVSDQVSSKNHTTSKGVFFCNFLRNIFITDNFLSKHSALSLFCVVRFWWTFYQDLSPWFSKEMMHWTIGKKWKLSHSPSRSASDNAASCSFNPDTELVGVRIPDYPFLRWAMISQFSILVMFSYLCYLHSIKLIF